MISRFWIDNKSSRDFGLYIDTPNVYESAAADVEYTSVPGRNGDLIISNNRYANVTVSYPTSLYAKDRDEMSYKIGAIKAWLNSSRTYRQLTDTYNRGYFRMASFSESISPTITQNTANFDISFNCKPFMYRNDGEEWITLSAENNIVNPEAFVSKPIIQAEVTNAIGLVSINNATLRIINATGGTMNITIDCETLNAYNGAENMNKYINSADYALNSGENIITVSGANVKIKPRWRRL